MDSNHLSEPPSPHGEQPPSKNVLKRDLPKPVVYAFFGILAIVVVIQLIMFAARQSKESQEREEAIVAEFEASQQRAEDRLLKQQIRTETVTEWVEIGNGAFGRQTRTIDPVLDDPDFTGLDTQMLENYFRVDRSLLRRKSEAGVSFAHAAVMQQRPDLLSCLIDHKGSVQVNGQHGLRPLQVVAIAWSQVPEKDDLLECATLLLDAGADPNRSTETIKSPTHIAATHTDKRLFDLLVEQGGEPAIAPLNP